MSTEKLYARVHRRVNTCSFIKETDEARRTCRDGGDVRRHTTGSRELESKETYLSGACGRAEKRSCVGTIFCRRVGEERKDSPCRVAGCRAQESFFEEAQGNGRGLDEHEGWRRQVDYDC